jgi:quinol monooxygenase YgiN
MSITTVLEIPVVDGKADEFIAILKKTLGDTRARHGCEWVTVHQDQADPNAVVLIERWASKADDEAYREWRAGPGAIDGLGAIVAGPPTIRYFDDADA